MLGYLQEASDTFSRRRIAQGSTSLAEVSQGSTSLAEVSQWSTARQMSYFHDKTPILDALWYIIMCISLAQAGNTACIAGPDNLASIVPRSL